MTMEMQGLPIIPLFHSVNIFLMPPSVKGYPLENPKSTVYSKNLYRVVLED